MRRWSSRGCEEPTSIARFFATPLCRPRTVRPGTGHRADQGRQASRPKDGSLNGDHRGCSLACSCRFYSLEVDSGAGAQHPFVPAGVGPSISKAAAQSTFSCAWEFASVSWSESWSRSGWG